MITTYTINRPDAKHAINYKVMDELEASAETAADTGSKVFLLTGAGERYFASGGDLKEFSELKSSRDGWAMSERMNQTLMKIESLPCLTVACVNGDAYGGGCELLGAFDVVMASDRARFGFTQRNFFLPPGWGGLTRLRKRVGHKLLLWLSSGAIIHAHEAWQSGLVDHLISAEDFRPGVEQILNDICETDDDLLMALKMGFRFSETHSAHESIESERMIFAEFWEHTEHHRRVSEFLKRNER